MVIGLRNYQKLQACVGDYEPTLEKLKVEPNLIAIDASRPLLEVPANLGLVSRVSAGIGTQLGEDDGHGRRLKMVEGEQSVRDGQQGGVEPAAGGKFVNAGSSRPRLSLHLVFGQTFSPRGIYESEFRSVQLAKEL